MFSSQYGYDFAGHLTARENTYTINAQGVPRTYIGPLIMEGETPSILLVDGGYITFQLVAGHVVGTYHFYVTDHQGNIRAIVDENGSIEKYYHYDPYGEVAYESLSSGPVNNYKYSGKEWDDKQKAYDFSARMYMPSYARFTTMDPLCEHDPGHSPYLYCKGNPCNRIDVSGEWDIKVHLYKNRSEYGYGIGIVTDKSGNSVYSFKVRAQGVNGSNRYISGSDTPLGSYSIPNSMPWIYGGSRPAYGPHPRLNMSGQSGEIIDTGRSLIRIHGGRQDVFP